MRGLLVLCLAALIGYSIAAEVCCPEIGCFTDDYPFGGMPLPWCMDQVNPTYTMFTRDNPNTGERFDDNTVPLVFDPALRTVFEVHGWQGSGDDQWLADMKDAFLARENMNVVIVGWEGGADIIDYPQASSNTRSTGAYTALVVENLVAYIGGSDTRMWCVGHSLGAHLCGHTGMKTQLERCTGLDPAGPWFENIPDETVGINPTSGRFVDIMHTDHTYGTERNLGHIDFYPNGGDGQPSCSNAADIVSCSHLRAVEYMIESINEDCYLSHSTCTSYKDLPGSCTDCTCDGAHCAIMGYGADYSCQMDGLHYIEVDDRSPYCVY